MNNINAFCGKGDIRDYLNQPMRLPDGTVFASNGHIGIIFNVDATGYQEARAELVEVVEKYNAFSFNPPRNIPHIADEPCSACKGDKSKYKCQECGGCGFVELENEFNEYEVDCKSCETGENFGCEVCEGVGHEKASIGFDGVTVWKKYVDLCHANLSNALFAASQCGKVVRITHDDGIGYLMTMNTQWRVHHDIAG